MRGFVLLGVLLGLCCAEQSWARGRRGYSSAPAQPAVMRVEIDPAAQAIAQQRADALAARQVLTHDIHNQAPGVPNWTQARVRGEGIGCSSNPDPARCPTCVVTSFVCADAHARGANGLIYRVRLFR